MSRLDNFDEILKSHEGKTCPVDVSINVDRLLYYFKDYISIAADRHLKYSKPIVCDLRGEIKDGQIVVTGVLIPHYTFVPDFDEDLSKELPVDRHPLKAGDIVGIALYCFDDPVSKHTGFIRKYYKMPLHLILNEKGENLLYTDAEKLKWAE